jgi:hypothetical protein
MSLFYEPEGPIGCLPPLGPASSFRTVVSYGERLSVPCPSRSLRGDFL